MSEEMKQLMSTEIDRLRVNEKWMKGELSRRDTAIDDLIAITVEEIKKIAGHENLPNDAIDFELVVHSIRMYDRLSVLEHIRNENHDHRYGSTLV